MTHDVPASASAADLLGRAADAADALAAGHRDALGHVVATVEALDGAWSTVQRSSPPGGGPPPLSRDELGDMLVTLTAAGLSASERAVLADRLATRLRSLELPAPEPAAGARGAPRHGPDGPAH